MKASQQPDILTHHTNDILYYHRTMHPTGDQTGKVGDLLCVMNFGERTREVELPLGNKTWQLKIYSADEEWSTNGSADGSTSIPEKLTGSGTDTVAIASLSIALYQADG